MWASAFMLLNIIILVLSWTIYASGYCVPPYDAMVATLDGTLFINILLRYANFRLDKKFI